MLQEEEINLQDEDSSKARTKLRLVDAIGAIEKLKLYCLQSENETLRKQYQKDIY